MKRSKNISGKVNEERNKLVVLSNEGKRRGSEGGGLRAAESTSSDKL